MGHVSEGEDLDYEIGPRIGGGGAGLIFEGRFRNERVAIKKVFGDSREFVEEFHVLKSLSHPHIVRLIGGCTKPPTQFMIMEYCNSCLFDCIHRPSPDRHRKLNYADKLSIARQVASAGSYLHSLKPTVVHRDIKSANVLLVFSPPTSSGVPIAKLCDFGLVGEKAAGAGTLYAMAPELLQGQSFTKGVDVYAFGILLWEMMLDCIPFQFLAPDEIRGIVVSGKRPPLSNDVPVEVKELIEECWNQCPGARPSFASCLNSLENINQDGEAFSCNNNLSSLDTMDSLDMLLTK